MELKLKVLQKPNNEKTVALFGHLIKCNHQIHSFQEQIIQHYLQTAEIIDRDLIKRVIYEQKDAVSFDEAYGLFAAEATKTQRELFYYMLLLAKVDGAIDEEERAFFDRLIRDVPGLSDASLEERAERVAARLRKQMKKENAKGRTGRRADARNNLFRIPQKEYVAAIDRCRKIARRDFDEILPICEGISAKGEAFLPAVKAIVENAQKTFHPEVAAVLSSFVKLMEEDVLTGVKAYGKQIGKKAAALEDFTIVLVGESKAGKSTLRAVLTGEGHDGIGNGWQRFTRVNHVYEWNHLRLIDTPGINAGSDTEDQDINVVKRVINEADLICFVTPTEGKFKKSKEFVTEILKNNKPVHVLVNYKNNLFSAYGLSDFLEEPDAWRDHSGENRIDGYYEPIRRAAEDVGVERLLSCDFVYLLAAQLSEDVRYAAHSKTLMQHSGVQEFLANLKIIVTEQGSFLRSKTIIDDTVAICENWRDSVLKQKQPILNCCGSLQGKRGEIYRKLQEEKRRFLQKAEKIIRMQFRELATTHARKFVEANYGCNQKELDKKWASYCQHISFEQTLKNKLANCREEYMDVLAEILEEIFEDVKFDLEIDLREIGVNKRHSAPFREIFSFLGGGAGLLGSIFVLLGVGGPAGWILAGVGLVCSLISSLFKKNKDRQKQVKEKMYTQLNGAVMSACEDNCTATMQTLNKSATRITNEVLQTYDDLLMGLNRVCVAINDLIAGMNENIGRLNLLFADRIVKYAAASPAPVTEVQRQFGKKMTIYTQKAVTCQTEKLKGLINEDLEFKVR